MARGNEGKMNFDWKAFEEGKLVYNARTEKDAEAFLADCKKQGLRESFRMLQYGSAHWLSHGESTCYICNVAGIRFCDIHYIRQAGIPIFSEPWKKQESVVDILRQWTCQASHCDLCHAFTMTKSCDECSGYSLYGKLADMVETELEEAKRNHDGCVPLPRWDNDEIVKEGDPYADTSVEHICVYSDGDWLLNMEDGSTLEGTLNQRAVYVAPDTQERINTEAKMTPASYCARCDIPIMDSLDSISVTRAMISHLLERQRKLDAKAGDQR